LNPRQRRLPSALTLDAGIGLPLGVSEIGQCAGLVEDERAQRIIIIAKVRFHQHEYDELVTTRPVKRPSGARSDGVHYARGASQNPPAMRSVGR